jgi:hypothetical protein
MKILSFDVGIVNLAYCIIESIPEPKILQWEIITIPNDKKFTAHNSSISDIYINLIKELDRRPILLDTDIVLIEKQPSFNPKMRIIAGCLQTYFYIRGVVDRTPPIKSVEFFSPKNKLKCYTGPELDISSKNGKIVKGKYAQTKKMGVMIARSKLEEYSETKERKDFFENNKKKDDLSDCYLQALTYIDFKRKVVKVDKVVKVTFTKKDLKVYLDNLIKNCSVVELMEKDYHTFGEIKLPEGIDVSNLTKWSMKKYLNFKYQ